VNNDALLEKIRHGDKNSFRELEELAENENAEAMSNLAEIYLKGLGGFEISYKTALKLFNKAAKLDDPCALFYLGTFCRDGKYGLEQDGYKAAEYFIKGAQYVNPNNVAKFLNFAAEIYRYGKGGVRTDGYKALEYLLKAADLGNNSAKAELAMRHQL